MQGVGSLNKPSSPFTIIFLAGPNDLKNDNSFQPTWVFRGDNYNRRCSFRSSKAFCSSHDKFCFGIFFSPFHDEVGKYEIKSIWKTL